MPRYYRRRYRGYRSGRAKYSNETTYFSTNTIDVAAGSTFPAGTDPETHKPWRGYTIVGATTVAGTRKVKNFDISLTSQNLGAPVVGALVYVPEGTLASEMTLGTDPSSLYEPNQNVICQFMIPANGETNSPQITRIRSRLARNLDAGDSIVMIFGAIGAISSEANALVCSTINYAIKF